MNIYIEVSSGDMWHIVVKKMLDVANATRETVYAEFNEVKFYANCGDSLQAVSARYDAKRQGYLAERAKWHQPR